MADAAEKGNKLIADIGKDARTEAERIMADAGKAEQSRIQTFERQMKEIKAEAEHSAATQVEAVEKTLRAAQAVEMRRISLAARDKVLKSVLTRVEEKMAAMITDRKYRSFLLGLVVEAAIGLGADKTEVNASPGELKLIDASFLKEASAKVKSLVLRDVTIKKSDAAPLLLQGIVLSADDGKTAYNNQIRTRLLRRQSEIRKLIYDRLQLQA